jgi:small-conductance mechanosensitive channel
MDATIGGITLQQILVGVVIVVVFIALSWLARFYVIRFAKKMAAKTATPLDDAIVKVIKKPIVAVIIVAGIYLAVLSLNQNTDIWQYTERGLLSLLTLVGFFTALDIFNAVRKWYTLEIASRSQNVGLNIRLISIFWIGLILVVIWLAAIAGLKIWGQSISPVTGWLGVHGWRIGLIIILSLIIIILTGEAIPRIITNTMSRRPDETPDEVKKRTNTLSGVLAGTLQIFVFFIAVFMILSELNIPIAPILTGAGVVGLAIGFGAQSLVKDLLAGLFIIIENQYRVGDVVRVADVSGVVEAINLRRTTLRDLDGIVHVVPNGEIRVASNYTKEWSRVNLNVSVAYGEDLDKVIPVINQICQDLAEDPAWAPSIVSAPRVLRVDNLGDSGIDIKILGDTKPMRQWDVTGELRLRLKRVFDQKGIEIPWPHTKVYFGNIPPELMSPDSPGKK